jgi:hypothetical protein
MGILDFFFGGANAAAMPGTVGPNGLVPPVGAPMDLGAMAQANPNPEIMFDPTLGKVVPGSLTPGMGGAGAPPTPTPNPMRNTWAGAPDMPPMARGAPSAPPAPAAAPPGAGMSAGNWSSAMAEQPKEKPGAGMSAPNWTQAAGPLAAVVQQEMQPYGGPDQPPMARGPTSGIPILDYLRANTPTYRTGGSF